MQPVRPTVRALRDLPRETFDDAEQAAQVALNEWDKLDLDAIAHPLIADMERQFRAAHPGFPGRHTEASAVAGRSVYEARMKDGAAWRGAVVVDEDRAWLVHVDRHDQFHRRLLATMASKNAANYLPSVIDKKLLKREKALKADLAWRAGLVTTALNSLSRAIHDPELPGPKGNLADRAGKAVGTLHVDVEVDGPPTSIDQAHLADALVTVVFRINTAAVEVRDALLQEIIPLVQPSPDRRQQDYNLRGELVLYLEANFGVLLALAASEGVPEAEPAKRSEACSPLVRHYVAKKSLAEAFVCGLAIRAVCGDWFVPTKDEKTAQALPVCHRCEEERPAAQLILDVLRRGD